ncbi:MAG: FtsQ-type POTRA domain-containing protein [Treponema sp.]|jgi:cell division protein FtsQ|nr:FtsQ-type POTRA domain-containing protein [Treponema sp.]
MQGDFIYSEDVLPAKTAQVKAGRGLKRLIMAAAFIIAAELIWLFAVSPCMPLETVEVNTFPGMDRDTVLSIAGIDGKSSWFTLDALRAEQELEKHSSIETAHVLKRFPDRVKIFLTPRTPAAMCLASSGGRTVPVYFDREGVIITVGAGGASPDIPLEPRVPILSGVVIDNPVPGMRLPAVFGPLLENIEKIGGGAPELLEAVSEIRINRKPFDGFDLVLYPVHNPVRVRLESDLSEDMLRYALLMIDVFKSRHTDLDEIDFRTATASYTVKEASSDE